MSLSPRPVQTRPVQPCSHCQSVPVPADGPVLAECPGQADAHGATDLQAPFLSLLGLAPSGGVQHSWEGPQDTGLCRAGRVKDRQGYRAAQGQGTSEYFILYIQFCQRAAAAPQPPEPPRAVEQQCSGAAGTQLPHSWGGGLGRWGAALNRHEALDWPPHSPPKPFQQLPLPLTPPTPWGPCQLGQWDAGPAIGQGEGSDHDPQAAPTPQDPSSPPRPGCPLG